MADQKPGLDEAAQWVLHTGLVVFAVKGDSLFINVFSALFGI